MTATSMARRSARQPPPSRVDCPHDHGLGPAAALDLGSQWLQATSNYVLSFHQSQVWGGVRRSDTVEMSVAVCYTAHEWGAPDSCYSGCIAAQVVHGFLQPQLDVQLRLSCEVNGWEAWWTTPRPLTLRASGEPLVVDDVYVRAPDVHAWIDSADLLETANVSTALSIYSVLSRESLPYSSQPWSLDDTSRLWRSALLLSA